MWTISNVNPPFYVASIGCHFRYYDSKEAVGAKMVRQVDKGRLSKEVYILHENIIGDREILLLTNKRLAYIQSNAVMGGWSCDWEYLYTDIQIPSIQLEGSRFCMIISPQVSINIIETRRESMVSSEVIILLKHTVLHD